MAVLIKGMEMPKACDSCRFLDDNGDYTVCWATSESVGYTFPAREKRMPHCPLKDNEQAQEITEYISKKEAVSRISDLLMIQLKGKRLPTWNEVYHAIND